MSYKIPPVNILVTFDRKVAIAFQKAASFGVFKKKVKQDGSTHFFDNGPNSTLISLKHTYIGDKKEGNLVIEFIDPSHNVLGSFVAPAGTKTFVGGMSTKFEDNIDPIVTRQKKGQSQRILDELPQSFRAFGEDQVLQLDENGDQIYQTPDNIPADSNAFVGPPTPPDPASPYKVGREPDSWDNVDFIPPKGEIGLSESAFINQLKALQLSPTQRPAYIAYGVGDDFRHWCKIKSFGRVLKVEYSFNQEGNKILKFIFAPLEVNTTLAEAGLTPLGHLANEVLTIGFSKFRLFHKEDFEAQKNLYLKMVSTANPPLDSEFHPFYVDKADVEKFFVDYTNPSLFLMIRDAIKDFIVTATGKKNVLVALPDLDKLLLPKLNEIMTSISGQVPDNQVYSADGKPFQQFGDIGLDTPVDFTKKRQAIELLLLSLGLSVTSDLGNISMVNNSVPMMNTKEMDTLRFQNMRATIQVDHTMQTVVKKLESVGANLSNIINESKVTSLSFRPPYVETDYAIISSLEDHNLIESSAEPPIIWGENNFIENFIEGRIMETSDAASNAEAFIEYFESGLGPNPMFILEGLNLEYLKLINERLKTDKLKRNSLGELLPFQSHGLPEPYEEELKILKEATGDFRPDTPLFMFGYSYSNILSFDVDMIGQFHTAFTTITPVENTAPATVAALLPPGFGDEFDKMYKLWAQDPNKITSEFKKACDAFIGELDATHGGNNLISFDEWAQVFKEFGNTVPKHTGDFGNLSFPAYTGRVGLNPSWSNTSFAADQLLVEAIKERKEKYFKFMWNLFSQLFEKHTDDVDSQRSNTKIISGKVPEIGAMAYRNELAKKLSQMTLKGTVKSIPMFHLSSPYSSMDRGCAVFCRESPFAGVNAEVPDFTWFSGIYTMWGFNHTITKDSVESEFFLTRGPEDMAGKASEKAPDSVNLYTPPQRLRQGQTLNFIEGRHHEGKVVPVIGKQTY